MKRLSFPVVGYMYIGKNVPDVPPNLRGKISFMVKIEGIFTHNNLLNIIRTHPEELRFVPPWRYQCLFGVWPSHSPFAGQKHRPSRTWIKLSEIRELPQGISPYNIVRNHAIHWGIVINDRTIEKILRG